MILSDTAIKKAIIDGRIRLEPFIEENLNGASYDVTLSPYVAFYKSPKIDIKNKSNYQVERLVMDEDGLWLKPNKLYLMSTNELSYTDNTIVPRLEGKSSLGRVGMEIHVTAGWGDPNFNGHWTLEVTVTQPLKVYPNIRVGQIVFNQIDGEVVNSYGVNSNYQNQCKEPQPSKFWNYLINE